MVASIFMFFLHMVKAAFLFAYNRDVVIVTCLQRYKVVTKACYPSDMVNVFSAGCNSHVIFAESTKRDQELEIASFC